MQNEADWRKICFLVEFVVLFIFTVLYFAHVFKPPFWLVGAMFITWTLTSFLKMIEE